MKRAAANTLVLLGYAAVATAYFDAPLLRHPGRYLLGANQDDESYVWSFAWWLHALETWQNPFYSHAIYAPAGVNLVWTSTAPGLGLIFAPITHLVGPDVSYNLAATLAAAFSAWTAYLLCRYLTGSTWPALVGGYLFGFSSYMLAEEQGHLAYAAVFVLPLMALAVVRYLRGEVDGRGLAWRLGVLYGLQFWFSTEILTTASLALVLGLALAYAFVPSSRARLRDVPGPLAGAVGIALLVSAPLVYYSVTGFQSGSIHIPKFYNGTLLNFVVPTNLTWVGGAWLAHLSSHFRGNITEQGAYLGMPTLAIVAWYGAGARRSPTVRYLLAALGAAVLVTLGTGLVLESRIEAWLPWRLVAGLPGLDNVLPVRMSVYVALAASVIVALWTASHHGWWRWLLPALAVIAIAPDATHDLWRLHPERWAFFTQKTYRICFPRNQNLAIFPLGYHDSSSLWQAESGFYFRLAGGYIAAQPPPKDFNSDPLIPLVWAKFDENPTLPQILRFVKHEQVDRIILISAYNYFTPSTTQLHRFGQIQGLQGVFVAPGCSYPSLRKGIHPTPPYSP